MPTLLHRGRQLGQEDDRDPFPQALRMVAELRPRAVLLENVRGLATCRFDTYRAQVLEQLHGLGYQTSWDLIHASDHGVPQLRPRGYYVGRPVIVRDHLNLTGRSPLSGPEPPPGYPPRFVDLTSAYSPRLRRLAREADPALGEGVYAALPGPHYETPAEIAMLRTWSACPP